ncbi:MAG: rhomboid family intramembrane serine protease [Tannerella sp.]|jgi:membrane associated rhomboid family serine protease|nr:rhomboid family intramembrane serine protease [Tannerella sp.]
MDIFTKIRQTFLQGTLPVKIIYINVGIFLLCGLINVVNQLFQLGGMSFMEYLYMPSSYTLFLYRPWTILTYMFLHADIWHILFNMLWLYWFGRIFLQFFNERQFGGLYLSGGIVGAVFFLISYNLFPYFRNMPSPQFLMGASASVMAIVFAVSFYRKDYEISLLFLGRIKLIYLALFTLAIDLISVTSENAGGHIAHLGGALFGILFATQILRGKDLTVFVNRLIDNIVNWRKRRRVKMKVVYRKTETDAEYNMRKRNETEMMDEILDKIKRSGYQSLTTEEKRILFNASNK